jgi:hypothetical protein
MESTVERPSSSPFTKQKPTTVVQTGPITLTHKTSNESTIIQVPNNSPVEGKKATQLEDEGQREKWCTLYDAAQPCGRSLSVNDPEYLALVRTFKKEAAGRNKTVEKTDQKEEQQGKKDEQQGKKGEQQGKKEGRRNWLKLLHF